MIYNVIDLDEQLSLPKANELWQHAPLCSAFMVSYSGYPKIRENKAYVISMDIKYVREHGVIPFVKYNYTSYATEYNIWTINTEEHGKLWD